MTNVVRVTSRLAIAVLAAAMAVPSTAQAPEPVLTGIQAVRSEFVVSTSDGRQLRSAELVGATLSINDGAGTQRIRIDAVETDPADPDHEVLLHRLSIQNPATGVWTNYCTPGPDGVAKAFPLSGSWTPDGRHHHDDALTIICSGGAVGKCVRWGYKPWKESGGTSLWDYHQACVRMVRADYGGDGVGHTRDGTPIDLFDRLGIQTASADPGTLTYEAAWDVDGALCVRKPRIAAIVSLDDLKRSYPRLKGRTGDACRESDRPAAALIFDRS